MVSRETLERDINLVVPVKQSPELAVRMLVIVRPTIRTGTPPWLNW